MVPSSGMAVYPEKSRDPKGASRCKLYSFKEEKKC